MQVFEICIPEMSLVILLLPLLGIQPSTAGDINCSNITILSKTVDEAHIQRHDIEHW